MFQALGIRETHSILKGRTINLRIKISKVINLRRVYAIFEQSNEAKTGESKEASPGEMARLTPEG